MNKTISLLTLTLLLAGCSTGVSQEDFDELKEEVTALKEENEELKSENEALKGRLGELAEESKAGSSPLEEGTVYVTTTDPKAIIYDKNDIKVSVNATRYNSSLNALEIEFLIENGTDQGLEASFTDVQFGSYSVPTYHVDYSNQVPANASSILTTRIALADLAKFGDVDWSGFDGYFGLWDWDEPEKIGSTAIMGVHVDFARNLF